MKQEKQFDPKKALDTLFSYKGNMSVVDPLVVSEASARKAAGLTKEKEKKPADDRSS